MTRERVTIEEYRALTARKPAAGSKRGSAGKATGTCCVCGGHVKATDPAQFNTHQRDDGSTESWVRHLTCRRPA